MVCWVGSDKWENFTSCVPPNSPDSIIEFYDVYHGGVFGNCPYANPKKCLGVKDSDASTRCLNHKMGYARCGLYHMILRNDSEGR